MKVYTKLFVAAGIALITSCNNRPAPKETREDRSTVEVDETAIAQQQIVAAFPDVYQFFSRQDTSFAPQKFVETETDTLQAAPALAAIEKVLKPYYPYLIYSPGSSHAIDL
jgi:hypothetical protein